MSKKELIEKLKRELHLRNYASSTISTYAGCLAVFLDNYKRYNGYKDIEDIKSFLLTIYNHNYHKQFVATIHHFYRRVIKRPIDLQDIPYPRKTHYLPFILSVQEVQRLVASCNNIKHRCILQLMYSCALRISEVTNVQIIHLDKDRKLLMVKGAKGYKDRYVPIPEATLILLRTYYIQHHPKKWLFNGQTVGEKYSTRSIQMIFKDTCKRANIIKPVTPHSLRHSRLTHLCEVEVNLYKLKEFAGHNNIKTTEIYLHLSKTSLVSSIEMADRLLAQLTTSEKMIA